MSDVSVEEIDCSLENSNEASKDIDPNLFAQVQAGMKSLAIDPTEFFSTLPEPVQRRVNALRNIQSDYNKTEAEFFEEVHDLEARYINLYQPLFDKRADIIAGKYDPTDEECSWPTDEEVVETKPDEAIPSEQTNGDTQVDGGIEGFWLTIFQHTPELATLVYPCDEPILRHLTDIRVTYSQPDEPISFTLHFVFSKNEFFSNEKLTKRYFLRTAPSSDEALEYDGPEVTHCEGCTIDWHPNKNVTVRNIKKKQKHKKSGHMRTISKQVANDSFFHFFKVLPAAEQQKIEELDDDVAAIIEADFELGHLFRESIIPRAILYFTGEAQEEDEEDFEEDDDDDDDAEHVRINDDN